MGLCLTYIHDSPYNFRVSDQMKMVEGKAAEQEVDYEFFKAGVDGRKEGEVGTDKRFGEIQFFLTHPHSH